MTLTDDNVFISDRKSRVDLSQEKSIGDLLIKALGEKHSQRTLFVDHASGREWKGAELKEKILNVAAALVVEYKMKPGTVCLVMYPCSDWYMILSLGIICAGGALASLACNVPQGVFYEYVMKIEPSLLFCSSYVQEWWMDWVKKDARYSLKTILMDTNPSQKNNFLSLLNYDRNTVNQPLQLPVPCDKQRDWAVIQITSGTTGTPKAAVFSHANILAELSAVCSPEPREVVLSTSMTIDYTGGRKIVFCGLYMGFKLILLPEHDIEMTLEVTQKYGVHMLYLSAFSLYNLVTNEKLSKYNIESVVIICGFGSKLVFLDELRKFLAEHKHIKYFTVGYGATEVATASRDDIESNEFLNNDHGTGKLECFNRVRIVDPETGKNLGKNKRGEIRVLNETTFLGYIDCEEMRRTGSNEPIIRGSNIFDEQGYYKTEDIGYFNDDEELFVEGRMKECFHLDGWYVLPESIEEVLQQQQVVHSVSVIGIQDKKNPIVKCPRAFVKLSQVTNLMDFTCEAPGEPLKYQGQNTLSSLPDNERRYIAKIILDTYESKVYPERRLLGGIVILDEFKTLPRSGKVDKQYLHSLTLDQIEVYGDRSE